MKPLTAMYPVIPLQPKWLQHRYYCTSAIVRAHCGQHMHDPKSFPANMFLADEACWLLTQEIMQVAVANEQYLIKDVLVLNGHSSQQKHSATLQIAKQKLEAPGTKSLNTAIAERSAMYLTSSLPTPQQWFVRIEKWRLRQKNLHFKSFENLSPYQSNYMSLRWNHMKSTAGTFANNQQP